MMDEQEPVDLSALDPMREPERWRAVVDATLLRVEVVLASRPRDPLSLIASWSRQITIGALVTMALLIPVEFVLERREAQTEPLRRLAELSSRAAVDESVPSGAELLEVLRFGSIR